MTAPLDALPTIPRDADGPVFRAPWEAQAFAMAVTLHERLAQLGSELGTPTRSPMRKRAGRMTTAAATTITGSPRSRSSSPRSDSSRLTSWR